MLGISVAAAVFAFATLRSNSVEQERLRDQIAGLQKSVDDLTGKGKEVQQQLSASGAEPVASTPEQFGQYMASEIQKWDRVVKQAKIPPVQ